MNWIQSVGIGVASVAVLGIGGGIAAAMVLLAPAASSGAIEVPPRAVEVVEVELSEVEAIVRATGTVQAARQVALSPEVSGRVVELDPRLRPGGRFEAGEVMLRVDARDYQTALEADRARLAQVELEVALERQRQRTAEREWALVGGEADGEPLALRRPHLAAAEANLRSAQAAVERSELNVARTRLRAPFNAIVTGQSVEVGQVVGPQGPVATLVGTDEARVVVSVPVERLASLDVPGFGGGEGSPARVRQLDGPPWTGRVTGLVGQLDQQTRTAQLIVSIPEPLSGERPLLPGAFVDVELVGRPIGTAARVPRVALTGGDTVWLARDGKLARATVEVGWRADEEVYVVSGLSDGDQVILSPLSLPIEGQGVVARTAPQARGEE